MEAVAPKVVGDITAALHAEVGLKVGHFFDHIAAAVDVAFVASGGADAAGVGGFSHAIFCLADAIADGGDGLASAIFAGSFREVESLATTADVGMHILDGEHGEERGVQIGVAVGGFGTVWVDDFFHHGVADGAERTVLVVDFLAVGEGDFINDVFAGSQDVAKGCFAGVGIADFEFFEVGGDVENGAGDGIEVGGGVGDFDGIAVAIHECDRARPGFGVGFPEDLEMSRGAVVLQHDGGVGEVAVGCGGDGNSGESVELDGVEARTTAAVFCPQTAG